MLAQILMAIAAKLLLLNYSDKPKFPFNVPENAEFLIYLMLDFVFWLSVGLLTSLLRVKATKEFLHGSLLLTPFIFFNFMDARFENVILGILVLSLVLIYKGMNFLAAACFTSVIAFRIEYVWLSVPYFVYFIGIYRESRCTIWLLVQSIGLFTFGIAANLWFQESRIDWSRIAVWFLSSVPCLIKLFKYPNTRSFHQSIVISSLSLHILGIIEAHWAFISYWLILDNLVSTPNTSSMYHFLSHLNNNKLPFVRLLITSAHHFYSYDALRNLKPRSCNWATILSICLFSLLYLALSFDLVDHSAWSIFRSCGLFYIWIVLCINFTIKEKRK